MLYYKYNTELQFSSNTFSTSQSPSVSSNTRHVSALWGWGTHQTQIPFVIACTVLPSWNPLQPAKQISVSQIFHSFFVILFIALILLIPVYITQSCLYNSKKCSLIAQKIIKYNAMLRPRSSCRVTEFALATGAMCKHFSRNIFCSIFFPCNRHVLYMFTCNVLSQLSGVF